MQKQPEQTTLRSSIAMALSCLYAPDQEGPGEFDYIAADRALEIAALKATPSDVQCHEQDLRAAAERVLGCWTIIVRTNGVLGADGLRVAIRELKKVCDSYAE